MPRNYLFHRSIFIDTSNIEEVKKWNATGTVDGVTTNQAIMLKDELKFSEVEKIIKLICKEMKNKPVSVELTDSTAQTKDMIKEGKRLNSLAQNIVVKVPMIPETTKSLEVIQALSESNIAINVTCMMTFEQMTVAALATRYNKRPSFISLFWGRSLEDQVKYRGRFDFMADYKRVGLESSVNGDPKNIVVSLASFLKEGGYETPKIIVGSIRTSTMVGEAFAAGANIVTITPEILQAMLFSQRTIETLEQFDEAWIKLRKK